MSGELSGSNGQAPASPRSPRSRGLDLPISFLDVVANALTLAEERQHLLTEEGERKAGPLCGYYQYKAHMEQVQASAEAPASSAPVSAEAPASSAPPSRLPKKPLLQRLRLNR